MLNNSQDFKPWLKLLPQAELAAEQLLVMLNEEKVLPEAAELQQSSQSQAPARR